MYFAKAEEPQLEKIDIHDIPVTGYVNQILLPVSQGIEFTVLPNSVMIEISTYINYLNNSTHPLKYKRYYESIR